MKDEKQITDGLLSNSKLNVEDRIIDYIIKIVGKYYKLEDSYSETKCRKRELVLARQIAMYFILKYSTATLAKTGSKFGNKDHATVLHAKNTIVNLIETDKIIRNEIKQLESVIKYKTKALGKNINFNHEFYHIDFNDFVSIKIHGNKGVMLSGFSKEEVDRIVKAFNHVIETREHENTGIYILEEREK